MYYSATALKTLAVILLSCLLQLAKEQQAVSFWPLHFWLLQIGPNIKAELKVFNYEIRGHNVSMEEIMMNL